MSEENKEKIAAVVVTYNRKQLLIECLNALLVQSYPLDAIYIVDNASTDGTPEYLMEKGFIDKQLFSEKEPSESLKSIPLTSSQANSIDIHYVRMHENTGGAGGFHEGVKRGYEAGFDWLWLMDDDGIPNSDCLEKLLQAHLNSNFDFLGPLVVDSKDCKSLSSVFYNSDMERQIEDVDEALKYQTNGFINNTANAFNGILVSRRLIANLGYPKKELFIWGDEVEYLLRVKNGGYKIVTVVNAIHKHPKNRCLRHRILGGRIDSMVIAPDLNFYCYYRNLYYINKKYKGFNYTFKWIIKEGIKVLLSFKLNNVWIFLQAICHSMIGIWGMERKYLL